MTVQRIDDTVMLEAVCPVDDAELLMQELQSGATLIDWSGCTHLHAACLQVMLAAGVPVRGKPPNLALERWVAPLLTHNDPPDRQTAAADPAPACLMEA